MKTPIVNIISEVVAAVSTVITPRLKTVSADYTGVRYDYGHPSDIVGRIAALSTTEKNRYTAYPLIGLFLDIPETRGGSVEIFTTVKASMFICCQTSQKYTPYERTQQTFVPILRPIYDEFMKQLLRHKFVIKPEQNQFIHTYIERYQWGKGGLQYFDNGKANTFNDFIDAIELKDFEIDFKENC